VPNISLNSKSGNCFVGSEDASFSGITDESGAVGFLTTIFSF